MRKQKQKFKVVEKQKKLKLSIDPEILNAFKRLGVKNKEKMLALILGLTEN